MRLPSSCRRVEVQEDGVRSLACRLIAKIASILVIVELPAFIVFRRLPLLPTLGETGKEQIDASVDAGHPAAKRRGEPALGRRRTGPALADNMVELAGLTSLIHFASLPERKI